MFRAVGDTAGSGDEVARATGIAMERYGLSDVRALALLRRLAQKKGVALGVIALAVVAASRRRAAEG